MQKEGSINSVWWSASGKWDNVGFSFPPIPIPTPIPNKAMN